MSALELEIMEAVRLLDDWQKREVLQSAKALVDKQTNSKMTKELIPEAKTDEQAKAPFDFEAWHAEIDAIRE